MADKDVPNYWDQAKLVVKNSFVAARFFHIYITAFIKTILGYDAHSSAIGKGGIFGHVSAYYGCVEAQGCGTLHFAGVDGGAFEQCLIQYLDDTISSAVLPDPDPQFHVQSFRGLTSDMPDNAKGKARSKDIHNLIQACQTHKHSPTCYKYWKGPPEPHQCQFDLDQCNVNSLTYFDHDTGELYFWKLDGLINNFNVTITEAVRCNTDVKFVGSGPCAKAVMYYITDYITKSQFKAHVAYAALESALLRLGPYLNEDDDITVHAKRLLQRCSYAMINQQELSAQQVASYLLDHGDHYTSHTYAKLFWPLFENYINAQKPSPECYHVQSNVDVSNAGEGISANDSDVVLTITLKQEMRKLPSQVDDYIHRHRDLDALCVWDMVARFRKERLHSQDKYFEGLSSTAMQHQENHFFFVIFQKF
ncbi:hypothetical protein FB446DRAFT_767331 [Lentinula raphanica]|nr:hypothetical protein FB446DRAFT_767331 [Lentinula raphanica]